MKTRTYIRNLNPAYRAYARAHLKWIENWDRDDIESPKIKNHDGVTRKIADKIVTHLDLLIGMEDDIEIVKANIKMITEEMPV